MLNEYNLDLFIFINDAKENKTIKEKREDNRSSSRPYLIVLQIRSFKMLGIGCWKNDFLETLNTEYTKTQILLFG